MNTVAKLLIDHKEWELHHTEISYCRGTRIHGRPCTGAIGGIVTVSFTPRGDEDDILRWMFADRFHDKTIEFWQRYYKLKKVEIVFYKGNYDGRILFKYKLEDCTCLYYNENFSNKFGMQVILVLSAAIQYYKNNNTFLVKGWQENWQPPQPYKTPVEEFIDDSPKFTRYYFKNINGQRIEQNNIYPNTKVILCIETQNAQGKTIKINLNDDRLDYEYNGEIMKNDIIKGIKITGDLTQISLKTILQNNEQNQ